MDVSKLKFVRIFDPVHIPVELVEQVRDRKYSVEKFYDYQSIVCLSKTENGIVINPLNLLFVIVNEAKKVVGFLWAVISPLTQDLVINNFSMHKDYWGKGKAVELIQGKCKEILQQSGLNRIYWITNYPKHSERYGFNRSKGVLMEYNLGAENGRYILRKRCEANGDSQPADSSTTGISEQHAESNSSSSEQCSDELAARV